MTEPPIDPTQPESGEDLNARVVKVRQQRLLLALEQWGPGYQRVTGNGLRYVAEIAHATPAEREWLAGYVAEHPDVWSGPEHRHDEWTLLRRTQGAEALAAADTAYQAGDWASARDHIDTTYALDHIDERQWQQMHEAITLAARGDLAGGA
jgi:hypothetical protein